MPVRREDPVLISSRREACLVLLIWFVACIYTVGVSYAFGYGRDAASLTFVLGFPDWIFWGVITPWTICTALCFVVPYFVITDEDLGEERAEESLGSASATTQEADHA